jgi:uncharacterized protein (DUF302 family)
MSYCFRASAPGAIKEMPEIVPQEPQRGGSGGLTESGGQATLRKKLDMEFLPNRALGACNPPCAYLGRQQGPMIGSMLPCGIVVQQTDPGAEVAAVDPVGSMAGAANPNSTAVAG